MLVVFHFIFLASSAHSLSILSICEPIVHCALTAFAVAVSFSEVMDFLNIFDAVCEDDARRHSIGIHTQLQCSVCHLLYLIYNFPNVSVWFFHFLYRYYNALIFLSVLQWRGTRGYILTSMLEM